MNTMESSWLSEQGESSSLFSLMQQLAQTGETLVPVEEFPMYFLLASEMARMAASNVDGGVAVLVDSQTAMQIDSVDSARVAAEHVYVFGAPPESWSTSRDLVVCARKASAQDEDLFFIALSPFFGLAIVCEQKEGAFRGGWTALRPQVVQIARALLTSSGVISPAALEFEGADSATPGEAFLSQVVRLSSVVTRQLMLRHRDVASDKEDLYSVLTILKAISAERRAHDILYVFVERIARAVGMDRCSVVRVWGGEPLGHVLASHEDESVSDLPIDLRKYPEVARAMEIRQKVVINDTHRDPLTRPFLGEFTQTGISSLIVIPVVLYDQNVGSLLLRAARIKGAFTLREINFCEIVAQAAANALERAQLFENIQQAKERLEHLAITDGLTGLYNHRYFLQQLEAEYERARRYELPLSCMIMDIDNFKRVNDTFGHLQGDSVLRGLASCALQTVRKSDVVARYGGEEFVVIMPQTGLEGARTQAERIRKKILEHSFEGLPDTYKVTVSIGVAVFDAQTIPDCEALIRVADGALYQAKREGKNRAIVGQL